MSKRYLAMGLAATGATLILAGCGAQALEPPHVAPPIGAITQSDYNNTVDAWVSRVSGRVVFLQQAKIAYDQGAYPMPLLATEAQTAAKETNNALHALLGTTPPVGDVSEEQNLLKNLTLLDGTLNTLANDANANKPTAVEQDLRLSLALAAQVESEAPAGQPTIPGTPEQQTPFPGQQSGPGN